MDFKGKDYIEGHLKRMTAQLTTNAINAYHDNDDKQGAMYEHMTQDIIKVAQKYGLSATR